MNSQLSLSPIQHGEDEQEITPARKVLTYKCSESRIVSSCVFRDIQYHNFSYGSNYDHGSL